MDLKAGFTIHEVIGKGRVKSENIDLIKIWLSNESIPKLTDQLIVSFLISNDNDIELTKSTIHYYFQIRNSTPEIFTNRNLHNENLQKMLHVGYYCLLPKRTKDNCTVIVIKLQDGNSNNFDFESHLKLICMLLDSICFENPPDGLISILDLDGTSLMHLAHIKIRLVASFTKYVQEAMPLTMKSVHLFNGGFVLKALFNIFKPFLHRKVKEMIHFHTLDGNMEHFYNKWISKDCLPEEYRGDLSSLEVHHADTIKKFDTLQSYLENAQTNVL